MNITLEQVMAINGLLQKIKDQKMPIKTSYKLVQLANEIELKVKFFEEKMQQIISDYGEKDEDGEFKKTEEGTGIIIKPNCAEVCQKEIFELSNLEVELKDNHAFSLDELDGIEFSIEDLKILMPFIKEDK